MEVKLQGILRNLAETTGDFTKIKYKGGNEDKISKIVKTLQEYLSTQKLVLKDNSTTKCLQELRNLTGLLMVNTEFKSDKVWKSEEYSHLQKAIPTLSKCLLANLVVALDLMEYCCSLILIFPLDLREELFHELISCLRQREPKKALRDTYTCIDTMIKILANLDVEGRQHNEEIIDKLADICSEMLTNISEINADWIQQWNAQELHEHMGHTLLSLLKLLQRCPLYTHSLNTVTDDVIRVSINIMKAVTINVFCVWAEIQYEQQPLQIIIAGEAYLAIEHLQKYKPAEEFVQMLGTIAKKPKTLRELILAADVTTMVANINKCDNNQKHWFRALINTNVLQNEEALMCVDRWAHLCSRDDVSRLLNMSINHKENRIKILIMKCAKTLNMIDLDVVASKYFRECYNTNNLDTGSVEETLMLLLNKAEGSSTIDEHFIKDIYLLLLQNSEFVLTGLFMQCLKETAYIHFLQQVFRSIKAAVDINNLSKTVFTKVFKTNPPSLKNVMCYKELLNMLLSVKYFQCTTLLCEIFMPQLQELYTENNSTLVYALQVLNLISIEYTLHENILPLLILLGNILEKSRFQFITFSISNNDITKQATDLLMKYISCASGDSRCMQYKDALSEFEPKKQINKFYIVSLYQDLGNQLLSYVYPTFYADDLRERLAKLIKLLPTCVTTEWILITKELDIKLGYKKVLSLFENIFLILCQIVDSQSTNNKQVSDGLKFCLQQYGIVIKDVLQPKYTNLQNEVLLAERITCLLKTVPKDIRKEEGLGLTVLLSDRSLHSLKNNREFILSLATIGDPTITQFLAQKML